MYIYSKNIKKNLKKCKKNVYFFFLVLENRCTLYQNIRGSKTKLIFTNKINKKFSKEHSFYQLHKLYFNIKIIFILTIYRDN